MSKTFLKFTDTIEAVWYVNIIDIVAIRENQLSDDILIHLSDGTRISTEDKEILEHISIYEYENE
jgi:hypothetical protein